jgi:AcrR family transcriptional regulator
MVQTARERILRTAYDLFVREGINKVGVDRISREADVTKMTLYRHFASKNDLAVAAVGRREELWSNWVMAEAARRGATAREQLLAVFDVFDEWFHRPDYEGCFFIRSLFESHERSSPVAEASVRGLAGIRAWIEALADQAGVADAKGFARTWQILMEGSIVSASAGDMDAARRAREPASLLLEKERS